MLMPVMTAQPFVAAGAAAQAATGWAAVQIFACPSGMTAATFGPWSCWVVTEGVEAQQWATELWLAAGSPDAPIPYWIVQTAPPTGAVDSMVQYAPAEGDASTVWLSSYASGADVHAYNIFP